MKGIWAIALVSLLLIILFIQDMNRKTQTLVFPLQEACLTCLDVKESNPPITSAVNFSAITVSKDCNLFNGEWIYDPEGPLYTNSTCNYISKHENCQNNGRQNTDYLYYRWKPDACDLPRLDAFKFLTLMKGKGLMFAGDSITQNHFSSLICALSQVEIPLQMYIDSVGRTRRFFFPSFSFSLAIFWAPYLVFYTEEAYKGVPKGIKKIELDMMDQDFFQNITHFDAIVISGGQWFLQTKLHSYSNGNLVGCYQCEDTADVPVDLTYAFRLAFRNVLDKLTSSYKGLIIMRTFATSHYENGYYGMGSCNRTSPFGRHEAPVDERDGSMRRVQMEAFADAQMKKKDAKMKLMDISNLSALRPDGHPNDFLDKPSVNDCLHWCVPGVPDIWNEILFQLLLQEFSKS